MRVRIHVTPGQHHALLAVLERANEPGVRVADFTASFDLADPTGWLEARMAEWPRGRSPRAALHGVARKLSAAIRSQVQPDPEQANPADPTGQAEPDPRPAVLRRAAALIRSGEELREGNARDPRRPGGWVMTETTLRANVYLVHLRAESMSLEVEDRRAS